MGAAFYSIRGDAPSCTVTSSIKSSVVAYADSVDILCEVRFAFSPVVERSLRCSSDGGILS